jgi:hypothetical protein
MKPLKERNNIQEPVIVVRYYVRIIQIIIQFNYSVILLHSRSSVNCISVE